MHQSPALKGSCSNSPSLSGLVSGQVHTWTSKLRWLAGSLGGNYAMREDRGLAASPSQVPPPSHPSASHKQGKKPGERERWKVTARLSFVVCVLFVCLVSFGCLLNCVP